MLRHAAPVLCALALAVTACTPMGGRNAALAPAGGLAARMAAQDLARFDLPTYERLTAQALAEALAAGDAQTVQRFVAFADGADPQPASSVVIAKAALAEIGAAETMPVRAEIVRIADGAARRMQAEAATGIVFPQDEGDHPGALTEWWYLNGHLETAGIGPFKTKYGYEFTLFKVGPLLHWAHVAISDPKGKRFKYTRQWIAPSDAKAPVGQLATQYGPHAFKALVGGNYQLTSRFGDEALDLKITPKKAPLLIGGDGKIDMPEGKDSWYYSQTRNEVTGSVTIGGEQARVTGTSWIDHQWGPFFVSGFADRWDWFALQFEDGTDYNLFGFRDAKGVAGKRHVNTSMPDGRGRVGSQFSMERLAWWQSPKTGMHYTTKWRVDLPETQEQVELEAVMQDQEVARTVGFFQDPLPSYWEGAMKATKIRADGKRISGLSYCEHFGFKTPAGPR